MKNCKILSIDAWRVPEGGWTWNAWYDTGEQYDMTTRPTNRAILRDLRDMGLLSEESKGRVAIEDDGYNIVIMAKGTREPLYAIEYGPHI